MADIRPFKGLRYNPSLDSSLGDLLCPPYDVISNELQDQLYKLSPHNAIRLEFGKISNADSDQDNRYTRASSLLDEWIENGVLLQESYDSFYLIQEIFVNQEESITRLSLLATVKLEEFSERVVLPHEETSTGPKLDRMELLSTTKTNLSPIMSIYRDNSGAIRGIMEKTLQSSPMSQANYQGTNISVWEISDRSDTDTIINSFQDAPVYLADGHHRYETALSYKAARHKDHIPEKDSDKNIEPFNFVMMSLIEIDDPGLLVLPYHRALRGMTDNHMEVIMTLLYENFDLTAKIEIGRNKNSMELIQHQLEQLPADSPAICLLESSTKTAHIMTLKPYLVDESPLSRCTTQVLGKRILEPVFETQQKAVENQILHFTHNAEEVEDLLLTSDYQLGFILPQLTLDLFEEVVLAGFRMPLKSTYFIPKLPSGLVMNKLG